MDENSLVPFLKAHPTEPEVVCHAHLPEVRERKWMLLRTIFRVISNPPYLKGSFEKALWSSNSIPWDAVPMGFFISMSIQEFSFNRKLRMDLKLKQLFTCFKKNIEVDAIDSREVLCSFRILQEFRKMQHETRKMFGEFLDIYSQKKSHFFERKDLLELFSLCAITEEEMKNSRQELDTKITLHAPRHGLKPTCRQVTRVVLEDIFEEYPALMEEFRTQCWDRMTHEMRTIVLKENIAHSQAIVETQEMRIKMYKATMLWRDTLIRKCFATWYLFLEARQKMHLQRSWMLEGYAMKACQKWHHWAKVRVGQRQRKYIASLMGEVRLVRRCFGRLVKNWKNETKIYWATLAQSPAGKNFMLGGAKVRWVTKRRNVRLALHHWFEYAQFNLAIDLADHLYYEALLRRVFFAFIKEMREIIRIRNYEADAMHRQKQLAQLLKDAEDEAEEVRKAKIFAEEKRLEYEKKRKEEEEQRKKEETEARQKEIKDEQRQLILDIQREDRQRRVEEEMQRMIQQHHDDWVEIEAEEVEKARQEYKGWLKTPAAFNDIDREFKFLRRDFYAAPTPEYAEREEKLKNLANIVFCNLSYRLFNEQMTLRELFDEVDTSGDGFLDHEELEQMVNSVGISLSTDQLWTVLQTIDSDESGYVSYEEFEAAMEAVQGVCGLDGSPWRLYIEPAQAVLCYHNIETGEKILDYKMTDQKLKEITLDEMVAKAGIKKRDEVRERKDKDWEVRMENWAATVLQKCWWLHQGRKARQHKRMVDETRAYRKEKALKKEMITKLQCWARISLSKQRARFRLQITYEKIPDPQTGVHFYYNHALGTSAWQPPEQAEALNVILPDPIDWSRQVNENGQVEYRNWKTGVIQETKPSGFPLCLACASTLACRVCRNCNFSYCFKCFRISHNHKEYENHEWNVLTPVLCQTCNKSYIQIRCKDCSKSFCEKCFKRIHAEGSPNEKHGWLNI